MANRIYFQDNLAVLQTLADGSVDLIYVDPPFNTGKVQGRTQIRTVQSERGDRTGFQGKRYETVKIGTKSYADLFDDYLAFLEPRLREAHRVLAPHGTLYFHVDYREVHYCKVLLDLIFGRECFLNEIIWAYDYGGRTTKRWPPKHDNILVYVKDPRKYTFNADAVDRIPYMAPNLVGPEKAARGKLPTDCYSDDTDVLTARGWIPLADLDLGDQVASVAPSGQIVLTRPTELHAYAYSGDMYHFSGKMVDLLVTPNHAMYLRPRHGDAFIFTTAANVSTSQYYALMNRLSWSGILRDRFAVPEVDYKRTYCAKPLPEFDMGDWCEFMGLYLAEGSATFYRDRTEVVIAQFTPEHLAPIASLLERLGLHYHRGNRGFVICNKQLASYLRQFGHANDKFIPHELLNLPPVYLLRLYQGLIMGDGHWEGDSWTYFTTSKRLADDVQELVIKLGYMANIRGDQPANPNWHVKYSVSRRLSKESTIFPDRHVKVVPYSGMVYCCTVEPFHTLIVRRNGKAAVCGNCWWHTIVPTNSREKTGYPTQKPLGILKRIVLASSNPRDLVLDFFAGSGTTGQACLALGRRFILVDNNPQALEVMARRFAGVPDVEWMGFDPRPFSMPLPMRSCNRRLRSDT